MIGVNETALRFWEKEFKEINPRRSGRGIRFYSNDDLETIKLIYHLTKEKGLTLEGARKRLRENRSKEVSTMDVLQRLQDIRSELLSIRNNIELIETKEDKQSKPKAEKNLPDETRQTGEPATEKEDDTLPPLTLF